MLCLFGPLEAALGFSAFLGVYVVQGWRPFDSLAPYGHVAHQATALTFLGIVGGQVGCLISQRDGGFARRLSLSRNPWIGWGLLFELVLALLLVYTPELNGLFSMTSVRPAWLLVIPSAACALVFVDALRRRLSRWRPLPPIPSGNFPTRLSSAAGQHQSR